MNLFRKPSLAHASEGFLGERHGPTLRYEPKVTSSRTTGLPSDRPNAEPNIPMQDLPIQIQELVESLCEAGEAFMADGAFDLGSMQLPKGLATLPEPRTDWSCAVPILAAIGDGYFIRRDFAECKESFMQILRDADGSPDNPFIRLRLGQCLYELGDEQEAANWLVGAYLVGNCKLFENDAPSISRSSNRDYGRRPVHGRKGGDRDEVVDKVADRCSFSCYSVC